jgi:hypothetical protein
MIAADPVLRSLLEAFDMSVISAAIAKAWPSFAPVKTCRIERFRYRPGDRAVFLYELETLTATEWVTGYLFGGRKLGKLETIAAEDKAFDAELNMMFVRFPADRKLPGLKTLLSNREELLSQLVAAGVVEASADAVISSVKPMRYRPGLAAVLRLELRGTGAHDPQVLFTKTYAKADVAEIHSKFCDQQAGARYRLARTLGCLPSENTVFWEAAEGTPLPQFLKTDRVDVSRVEAGLEAVVEFHNTPASNAFQYAPASSIVAAEANSSSRFISAMLPGLCGQLDHLCKELPAQFCDDIAAPVHTDMKPEHIFLSEEKAMLIDVEGVELSDPVLDLGNLMARFEQLSRLPGYSDEACRRSFSMVEALAINTTDKKLVASFTLGKLKTAAYAVRHQKPGWASEAETIVNECLNTMSGSILPLPARPLLQPQNLSPDPLRSPSEMSA